MHADEHRAREILDRVLAAQSEGARQRLLDEECRDDAAMHARVKSLLSEINSAEQGDPGVVTEPGTTVSGSPVGHQGTVIDGRYRLIKPVGEGGMGAVWLAAQTEPVRRQVAIKLIKPGMDSRQVLRRFEAERQALAIMDHPHIAKVLDGGVTEQQRPYFVMEYVAGVPLTDYCDQAKLSLEERVSLFCLVCRAVQHAHQKGIIHRDLKPSNILVHQFNGQAIPRIIDFGLAKALHQPLTSETLFTAHGAMLGTPLYMSPEQADTDCNDVDTRTDIYALGVILYELLTGTTPLERQQIRHAGTHEVLRLIQDHEPPRPSLRVSNSTDLDSLAAQRQSDSESLSALLSGDLDWIVMKALEKDRSRRYASASGLAAELDRFLEGEPVLAAPPGRIYRLRKFVRRNRMAVTAASIVASALLLGILGTSLGMAWAIFEMGEAEASRNAAIKAEQEASQRAEDLHSVAKFQAHMLEQFNTAEAGRWLTERVHTDFAAALRDGVVSDAELQQKLGDFRDNWQLVNATDAARKLIDKTILQPAVETLDRRFRDQPVVRAQLQQVIADRYRELGLLQEAAPLQVDALTTRRKVLGDEHPDTLGSVASMGILLRMQGQLDKAEPYYREVLDCRRRTLGSDHIDTIDAIGNMAVLLDQQGYPKPAGRLYHEALERSQRNLGDDHEFTLISTNNLAFWLQDQKQPQEAEALFRSALKRADKSLEPDNPVRFFLLENLAYLLQEQGRMAEAERPYLDALEGRRMNLGEKHPDTMSSRHNLAYYYSGCGRTRDAEDEYRIVISQRQSVLGLRHPQTMLSMHNQANVLADQGRLSEAEDLCRETLDMRYSVLGARHPHTADSAVALGSILCEQDKFLDATAHFRLWLGRFRLAVGRDHLDTITCMVELYAAIQELGAEQLTDAEQIAMEAYERYRSQRGDDDPDTLRAVLELGSIWIAQEKYAELIELLARTVEASRTDIDNAKRPEMGLLLMKLGSGYLRKQQFEAAGACLTESHEILSAALGSDHRVAQSCHQAVIDLLQAWHEADPAGGHDAELQRWRQGQ